MFYNTGLPSSPRLLGRSGASVWSAPVGLEAYRFQHRLRVVVNHALSDTTIWEDVVAPEVHAALDMLGVKWTSTDVVHIYIVNRKERVKDGNNIPEPKPAILWIGVDTDTTSLSHDQAVAAAHKCAEVLRSHGIDDVDVEIRKSQVIRSSPPTLAPASTSTALSTSVGRGASNPQLMKPAGWSYRDIETAAHHPLTHALSLPVSAQATPNVDGTGGFFMVSEDKLLLVTARHVVSPPGQSDSGVCYEHLEESQPRYTVLHLGDAAYQAYVALLDTKMHGDRIKRDYALRLLQTHQAETDDSVNEDLLQSSEDAQKSIKAAENGVNIIHGLQQTVKKQWATHSARTIGHVVYSPPLRPRASTADEGCTEDYAIIEIDDDKIDREALNKIGNAIDLDADLDPFEFVNKMPHNAQNSIKFEYPFDRLLRLKGTIPDEEMRTPNMKLLDRHDKPVLIVLKDGTATRLTYGRASGIMSFVREYFPDGTHRTSKKWAILPYDEQDERYSLNRSHGNSRGFAEPGDSGAAIVDGQGRIGGLLTCGAGTEKDWDIAYATPISFLEKSIRAKFPDARIL